MVKTAAVIASLRIGSIPSLCAIGHSGSVLAPPNALFRRGPVKGDAANKGSPHGLLEIDAVDGSCSASCAKLVAVECSEQEGAIHHEITTIGLDIAKRVFQAHGADVTGKAVFCRKLQRAEMLTFFAATPPCLVGIGACSTTHHWAREIRALGHEVRLMPTS